MYSSVLVTAPDIPTAKRMGRSLVEMGLAACVNIWHIDSIYRWKGEVKEGPEVAMLFKVTDAGYQEFYRAVLEIHPYEVPCIVRYTISDGHIPYLEWVEESTRKGH